MKSISGNFQMGRISQVLESELTKGISTKPLTFKYLFIYEKVLNKTIDLQFDHR